MRHSFALFTSLHLPPACNFAPRKLCGVLATSGLGRDLTRGVYASNAFDIAYFYWAYTVESVLCAPCTCVLYRTMLYGTSEVIPL